MQNLSVVKIVIILLVAVFLISCNTDLNPSTPINSTQFPGPQNPIKAVETKTPVPEPTHTASPFPTETPLPTLTPTPDYFLQDYPLSNIEYVIPLTVRHVSDNRVTFFFELQNPAGGMLVYRSVDAQFQGEIEFSADKTRHMITVENLSPGTAYEAMILLTGSTGNFQSPNFAGKEWDRIQFRTATNQWPLRVGVLGDASFGDEATQRLVELIAAQDLDYLIHTGDVVYETDSSDVQNSYLRKFFEPFSLLLHQGPIYTVLGNHDYDSTVQWEGAPFYDYAFPPFPDPNFSYPETRRGNQYYAISYQDIQFLMLDTHIFAGGSGRDEQDAWLQSRLDDPRFRVTIPIFHVAPFSSSIVHPDDGKPVRLSWNWRFEEANVPLVLSGHFHHYERLISNGITYIVSGGGSSTLYAQGELLPESKIYARRTHFVLLEIFKDHINLTAVSLDGDIIDQTTINLE
jgi:predicted phosphodiesterase